MTQPAPLTLKDWIFGLGFIAVVFVIIALWAESSVPKAGSPEAAADAAEEQDRLLIAEAELAIEAQLRDPRSAEYSGESVHTGSGAKVVCGTVNAANAFGGMSGPQRFIYGGHIVLLENEAASFFGASWADRCR